MPRLLEAPLGSWKRLGLRCAWQQAEQFKRYPDGGAKAEAYLILMDPSPQLADLFCFPHQTTNNKKVNNLESSVDANSKGLLDVRNKCDELQRRLKDEKVSAIPVRQYDGLRCVIVLL